jgi:hypothetical protein
MTCLRSGVRGATENLDRRLLSVVEGKAASHFRGVAPASPSSSIAGLLSARVLSDHFEEVVVIDPDADVLVQRALAEDALRFPDGKDAGGPARPRVMQWTAYHLVQAIYFTALDHLFPSLHNELVAADCP